MEIDPAPTTNPAASASDATTVPASNRRTGVVATFDEQVGLGLVNDGELEFPFHAVAIADGSRRIEVGATVNFSTHYRFGRREAAEIHEA